MSESQWGHPGIVLHSQAGPRTYQSSDAAVVTIHAGQVQGSVTPYVLIVYAGAEAKQSIDAGSISFFRCLSALGKFCDFSGGTHLGPRPFGADV